MNKNETKDKMIEEASSKLADIFVELIDDMENKKKENPDIKQKRKK